MGYRKLLLMLCAILEGVISITFLTTQGTALLGKLTLAAAACVLAAGLWRGSGRSWLLVLNGLALATIGVIFNSLFRYRVSFRTIAFLLAVMALSNGLLALQWSLRLAGSVSLGFALALLALSLRWIPLGSGRLDLIWMGSFFGFSALCLMALVIVPGSTRVPTGRALL